MKMKTSLKRLYTFFYRFNVGIIYILFWPVMYYFSLKEERYPLLNKMRSAWGYISSLLSGIRYRYELEKPIDWSRTYIICPHHTSSLDITAISILAKRMNYSFMGKDELLNGFVTGLFFRSVDLPVNRKSKVESFRAFKRAGELLQNGTSMVIFPEGTISGNYPPKVVEFKNGPFKLAIEMKVPIIPVTALDTWKVLWDEGIKYGSRPGVCHIFVHEPIETAHLTTDDADRLRDEVYAIIEKKLAQHDN